MNIEFTVEDYFKELRVMENYYGQEEELYPWMYMLLQMIEFRKKSNRYRRKRNAEIKSRFILFQKKNSDRYQKWKKHTMHDYFELR